MIFINMEVLRTTITPITVYAKTEIKLTRGTSDDSHIMLNTEILNCEIVSEEEYKEYMIATGTNTQPGTITNATNV